ncbi:glycosyltransferase [Clostridium sp. FS41]|uniref:glycosyltransferase n=1 Tax=Clostridia TaxID=186801 RepID=UPI0005D4260D|nr:glycosyltransferase [Clostridium sp. FS41]KJJ66092.1 abequosyltransferase RfbV [Clostridium sp. FS41]
MKLTENLVSIVVLSYQNLEYLNECILSILNQDYSPIQLIVSDDASDFFDEKALEMFIEENKHDNLADFKIIANKTNVGTVKNIINAFTYVKGDFYITSGADDLLADNSVVTRFIQKFQKEPEDVWVCGKLENVSENLENSYQVYPTEYDISVFEERDAKKHWNLWARRGVLCTCSICYRKQVLEIVGGFDASYAYVEDWPVFLKLLRNGYAPGYIDKIVAKRRIGGISRNFTAAGSLKRKRFLQDKYHLFEEEVNPYINEMSPEDLKKYKYYIKELLDRTYFFDCIYSECGGKWKKFKLMFSSPQNFLWILEFQFWQYWKKVGYKMRNWNVLYTILLFFLIYINCCLLEPLSVITFTIKGLALGLGTLLTLLTLLTFLLKGVFSNRAKKRVKVTES